MFTNFKHTRCRNVSRKPHFKAKMKETSLLFYSRTFFHWNSPTKFPHLGIVYLCKTTWVINWQVLTETCEVIIHFRIINVIIYYTLMCTNPVHVWHPSTLKASQYLKEAKLQKNNYTTGTYKVVGKKTSSVSTAHLESPKRPGIMLQTGTVQRGSEFSSPSLPVGSSAQFQGNSSPGTRGFSLQDITSR